MLTKARAAVMAGILMAGLWAAPAWAGGKCNEFTGVCESDGETGGGGGGDNSGGDDNSGGGGGGNATVCRMGAVEVPCSKNGGTWSSAYSCYMKLMTPQPPQTEPVWGGRTNGAIYQCSTSGEFTAGLGLILWQENAPELPPPDPEVLARRAVASLALKPISMGSGPATLEQDPTSLGAVGMPNWLWADETAPNQTGPISASASERGFTVTVQARLNDIEWNLGDGSASITCGLGQRFDPRTMDISTPVVCGRQNGYQKQGEYTISATSHWVITWSGIGESGVIEMDRETSGTVRIGEIQTVIR